MSEKHTVLSQLRHSEQGMVSIMTTLVLMVVISLIVLGFAQISQRNQRESLDRQLSTQAFYAAESGVNDARNIIRQAVSNGLKVEDKNDCDGTGNAAFYTGLQPNISDNVKYTCLLVDASPKELRYSDIGTTSSVVPIITANGDPISTIKLEWQSKITSGSPTTGCPTTTLNVFTPTGSWNCGYGVLRMDLVPTAGNSLTMDSLRNSTMSTTIVPFSVGGRTNVPFSPGAGNQFNRISSRCSNTSCSLEITGLAANSYHMRISSMYKNAGLQITATGATGNQLEISGAQAVIDVTGKAQDVLRRIQVNVPLQTTSENKLSDYAIEAQGSLCKRYSVMNGFLSVDGNGITSTNPLCQTGTTP